MQIDEFASVSQTFAIVCLTKYCKNFSSRDFYGKKMKEKVSQFLLYTFIYCCTKLQDEHNTEQYDFTSFLLNNSYIIDRAQHWSNLLFKEALAIRRQKPELNHGIKASRELSQVFY